jgi:hypothetical protein
MGCKAHNLSVAIDSKLNCFKQTSAQRSSLVGTVWRSSLRSRTRQYEDLQHWAMLLLGFAEIGFIAWRAHRRQEAVESSRRKCIRPIARGRRRVARDRSGLIGTPTASSACATRSRSEITSDIFRRSNLCEIERTFRSNFKPFLVSAFFSIFCPSRRTIKAREH